MANARRLVRVHASRVGLMVGLMVLASAVGVYVLGHQRLRLPFVSPATWTLNLEFSTAQAVVPGQGQTLRVSGIRIGDIRSVRLARGRAVVAVAVDAQYRNLVHPDATALLRPRTGLKDMFIELQPGRRGRPVPDGWTVPVEHTEPDVNTDEVLAALDGDTRDYVRLLLHDLGTGLDGRGATLGELLRRLEPTHRDLARVSTAVAVRQASLRRLVGHLGRTTAVLRSRDGELARLVDRSSKVFTALGAHDRQITRTVSKLPAALESTTTALARVRRLADAIPPATTRLRPTLQALTAANARIIPAARANTPVLRDQIRPFTRAAQPVVADLRTPTRQLADAAPDLTRATGVLNHLFNLLSYNPGGRQGPEVPGREEGYLYWLGWLGHQSVNLFSGSDAHGALRPIALAATCQTLKSYLGSSPQLEFLLGLSPVVTSPQACGEVDIKAPPLTTEAKP